MTVDITGGNSSAATKTRGFLTWEKREHLVKLAILILAAVLCEFFAICCKIVFAGSLRPANPYIHTYICTYAHMYNCACLNSYVYVKLENQWYIDK